MKSVYIITPCGDMVHSKFMLSYVEICNQLIRNGITFSFGVMQGSSISQNRNKAVQMFLTSGLDYLMFIDSDMKLPGDAVVRLLNADRDIIGATYLRKTTPHYLNHVELDGSEGRINKTMVFEPLSIQDYTKDTAIFDEDLSHLKSKVELESCVREVLRLGTGCMLISRKVLENMVKPWFQFYYEEGSIAENGEDYWFCKKARNDGFKVWVDMDLSKEVSHIGSYEYKT